MGIVAGDAGKLVADGALAGAVEEGFVLTDGAVASGGLAGFDEVDGDVCEVVAGDELRERAAGPIDDGFAFEVALDAGAVTLEGSEVCGVGDGAAAALRQVLCGVAMTGAAADASLKKWLAGIGVARRDLGRLDVRHVAVETVRIGGKRRRHAWGVGEGRGHLPGVALGVEVDGELEPLVVDLVEIGAALRGRADEILQGLLAGESAARVGGGATVGHPGGAVAFKDTVVHVGAWVVIVAGDQAVDGEAAAAGHLGAFVVVVDFFVATRTDGVRMVECCLGCEYLRGWVRMDGFAEVEHCDREGRVRKEST